MSSERRDKHASMLGQIVTFYSYKGGVGRSMALANVAALLAKWGHQVLVMDWDIEAPGIERYFACLKLSPSREETPGLLEILSSFASETSLDWHECLLRTQAFDGGGSVHMISAGKKTEDYAARVGSLNWDKLFSQHQIGERLDRLRQEWIREYEFVLIDSRTGITDIGGICTVILPDASIVMLTTNEQSLEGITTVVRRARESRDNLPTDRGRLLAVPILARDESEKEYELTRQWRDRIASELGPFYKDWIPQTVMPRDVLEKLYLPYKPFWSFGERLPVIEEPRELQDPSKLGFAYARLATLIRSRFDWSSIQAQAEPAEVMEQQVRIQKIGAEKDDALARVTQLEQQQRRIIKRAAAVALAIFVAVSAWGIKWSLSEGSTDELLTKAYAVDKPPNIRCSLLRELRSRGITTFASINLQNCDLAMADLRGADLRGAKLEGALLSGALLNNAKLGGAKLGGATLTKADFTNADLSNADLSNADLSNAKLSGANLEGAQIKTSSVKFDGADLSDANLSKVAFGSDNFVIVPGGGCVRDSRIFENHVASFVGANLSRTKILGANLIGADLTEADLTEADLTEAFLFEARLTSANLSNARLLKTNYDHPELVSEEPESLEQLERGHRQFNLAVNVPWDQLRANWVSKYKQAYAPAPVPAPPLDPPAPK